MSPLAVLQPYFSFRLHHRKRSQPFETSSPNIPAKKQTHKTTPTTSQVGIFLAEEVHNHE